MYGSLPPILYNTSVGSLCSVSGRTALPTLGTCVTDEALLDFAALRGIPAWHSVEPGHHNRIMELGPRTI